MSHTGDVATTELVRVPRAWRRLFDPDGARNSNGQSSTEWVVATRPHGATRGVRTMDFDPEAADFPNQCRLFPLPDLVLFPHALLPLHIFEPRYRQMTADALAEDGLVTMVQIRPPPEGCPPWAEPVPIMDVGCLGKIVEHERLDDGRFNIVLLGWKR